MHPAIFVTIRHRFQINRSLYQKGQTRKAYYDAKKRLEVPFGSAAYLVDLYSFTDEMLDTFPLSEEGYRSLPRNSLK